MKRKLEINDCSSHVKIPKSDFTFGSSFRKKLKTNDAVNALNDFNQSQKERNVVTEYINAGGSAKELVGVMKQFDGKKDPVVGCAVFSALHSVVVSAVDDLLLIQKNVEEACEELLCSYHTTIQNMLCSASSSTSHRIIVLKLLTGMVTLSAGLAKQILTLFPMNAKLLKILTDSKETKNTAKLRTSFIHYLLSFLIDENTYLIAELLKIKGLLTSIVPGLMNDKLDSVILVLNTFRQKIVENPKISKTLKIHTFNTPILRSLFRLYDYKLNSECENLADTVTSLDSLRLAVHSLLVLLCTSFKKGLLFRERGLVSSKSPNQLIFTLLEDITSPWKDDLKSQLVTEILKVCPEFLKTVFTQLESYLHPHESDDWKKLMLFLQQIIEKQEVNVEILREQSNFSQFTAAFYPNIVQKFLRDHCDENLHQNPSIRFQILSLLHVCLHKMAIFLEECLLSLADQSLVNTLKDHIEQFLNKNSVSCSSLVTVWNLDMSLDDSSLNISEYYHVLANVLLLYHSLCPIAFNQLHINGEIDLKAVDFDDSELQYKRAQLIYLRFIPKPGNDQFPSLFRQFVHSFIKDGSATKYKVLENLFLNIGFFEGFEKEISIWMYSIQKIPVERSSVICDLLVEVFVSLSKTYKNCMTDVSNVACENEEVISANTDIYLDFFHDMDEYFLYMDEASERISKPDVWISPVMSALFDALKCSDKYGDEDDSFATVELFILRLLVHLLHLQGNLKGLLALLDKYQYMSHPIYRKFRTYIDFWDSDTLKLNSFEYPLGDEKAANKLSTMLVKKECDAEILSELDECTDNECVLLWNLCSYYSTHLSRRDMLQSVRYDRLKNTFSALREKLSHQNKVECLQFTLTDMNFINSFNLAKENGVNSLFTLLLKICQDFKKHNSLPKNYTRFLTPYRQRMVLVLLKEQHLGHHMWDEIIQFVMLSGGTIAKLLNSLSLLPMNKLTNESKTELSEWFTVIQCLFHGAAENLQVPVKNESLHLIMGNVKEFLKLNINVDKLETSIVHYLRSFPHHIRSIPEDIVIGLIEQHPTVSKLVLYLLPHYPASFSALTSKICNSDPVMDINKLFEIAQKYGSTFNYDHILRIIFTHHFPSLISWIDGVCVWEMKYADLVSEIFLKICDAKNCSRLCKKIKSKWSTVLLNIETCVVMKAIFENANRTEKCVLLLMSRFVDELSSTGENVKWLCSSLYDIIEGVEDLNFLLAEDIWMNFVKLTLKISLQTSNSNLMRTLRLVCDKTLSYDNATETSTIFQMTISHSEFVNSILKNSEVKCELVKFYLLLATKNESLMSSNHIPLLLSAYNATLSESDQILLQVLQWYETNKIRFSDCKPYLWGESAVTHHSIRTEISVSLKRQPQPNQVLELLDINIVRNTIRQFSLNRSLHLSNEINEINPDVYDLSFMLPLMSHLLAPESRLSVQKFTRSGALALVLVSLSSQQPDVRMAAFHCLQRFQSHLNSREKEIQIWDHFVNALKNGILGAQFEHVEDNVPPTLSCIVTQFLAHMSLIISEPLHVLFVPLAKFLLAKPSFDVNTVPDFLSLFYSSDLENRDHQEWMLRIIRDGMRSEADWMAAQKCFFFKLILQFYSSASSNEATNVLIIEILCNAFRICSCREILISKFGLLSWLNQIIQNGCSFNQHFLSCLINIFESLKTIKNTSTVVFTILGLLRKLHLTKVDRQCIENLYEILSTLYCYNKVNVLTKKDLEFLIEFALPYHSNKQDKICRNCITYSSVIGVGEFDNCITNHLISMIRRFLNRK